jgi:ribulose-5-phosphate 4-epimerase/fuculose-1-phosphate aldolase
MSVTQLADTHRPNLPFYEERCDLAAAFRWTARLNMHEAVANHFSLAFDEGGRQILINPNLMHFSRIKASDLLLIDANDPETMKRPDAPDPTAWGLHGAIHRNVPHARCVMHVHSVHATVLASLADSRLPAIDQNSAMFHGRQVVDAHYGGLAFEEEGERCSKLFSDPKAKVMVMGNHGVMIIGETVGDTFDRLYYFERACETYIKALWTGQPIRHLSDEIAERVATQMDNYPVASAKRHLEELKAILDEEGSNFRN